MITFIIGLVIGILLFTTIRTIRFNLMRKDGLKDMLKHPISLILEVIEEATEI